MKVHETRSHSHSSGGEEEKMMTRKQKAAESKGKEDEHHAKKKAKLENDYGKASDGKSRDEIAMEFDKFCKSTSQHLSIQQMRDILEANGQDPSGSDDAVVPRW